MGESNCTRNSLLCILLCAQERTIAPLSFALFGNLVLTFVLVVSTQGMDKDQRNYLDAILSLVATPILAKVGIDKSRNEAKPWLIE